MMGDFSIGSFFINPVQVLAYQPFCDTVFQVDGEGNMEPRYHLNFGNHHAPDELYTDMANVMNPSEPYFLSPALYQTKNQLFIRIRQLNKYHFGIYQMDDGSIFSIKTDNNRIPNDLDGGPDFWPTGTDGNTILYKMIQPIDILNIDPQDQTAAPVAKDAEAAKAYQELLDSLNEDDNPVVMVVKLKK